MTKDAPREAAPETTAGTGDAVPRSAVPWRVVVADDHPVVLDGLDRLLGVEADFEVVARCRDGAAALEAVAQERPDLLVLDVRMPRLDGLEVLRRLGELPDGVPPVLVLTAAVGERDAEEALRLGARGVVLKDMASRLLVEAARTVAAGGEWLDQELGGRLVRQLLDRQRARDGLAAQLTTRERQVVARVARGLRNREIADELRISEGTVKIHLHNVYEKLGVGGRVELALRVRDLELE